MNTYSCRRSADGGSTKPCSDAVADQLKQISASTIDRLLGREKRIRRLRRNRNPNVQGLIYQKVPVKVAAECDTSEIGNVCRWISWRTAGGQLEATKFMRFRRSTAHQLRSQKGGERRTDPDAVITTAP